MKESKNVKQPTSEFKEAAVKRAIESEQSINQTARDLGISKNTLHGWVKKYRQTNKNQGQKSEFSQEHLYDELKRLKKENAHLKEDVAILKKAAAYFARDPR